MKKISLLILLMSTITLGGGRSHYQDNYNPSSTDTMTITNFDEAGWAINSSGDSVVDDLVLVKHGSKSKRAYCHNSYCRLQKTVTAMDLSVYDFFILNFNIKAEDKKKISDSSTTSMTVWFLDGGSIYYTANIDLTALNTFNDGWYSIPIPKPKISRSPAGAVDLSHITYLRISFMPPKASVGGTVAITFDRLLACKSVAPHGAMVFSFDVNDTNIYTKAYPLFAKHNSVATLFIKRYNVGLTGKNIRPSQITAMQSAGWGVGTYPWNGFDTSSIVAMDTNISKSMAFNRANGWRGYTLHAWSNGYHNRALDSVAKNNGIDFARIVGADVFGSTAWGMIAWTGLSDSARLVLPCRQYTTQTMTELKSMVDSARINKCIGSLQLEGINIGGGTAIIDSAKLDTLLTYCDTSGIGIETNLSYIGKYEHFLKYAPDSLITVKLRETTTGSYALNCSLSVMADSAKVFLHEYSNAAGAGDTILDSTALIKGGSLFRFDALCKINNARYYYRMFPRNNSGTIDSTFSMDSVTVQRSSGGRRWGGGGSFRFGF